MRVLFARMASAGHTYPLIPLAIAARAAGHEVHFAAGENVHPPLAANGLRPFRPADAFYELYAEDLEPELARLRPDLVVHEWGVPGWPSPPTAPASPASGTASAACSPKASAWSCPPRPRPDGPISTDVPVNVTVHPWVPQADLLPQVDVVVHHGGSGTMLGALTVGAPQLLLPQGADQVARRLPEHTTRG